MCMSKRVFLTAAAAMLLAPAVLIAQATEARGDLMRQPSIDLPEHLDRVLTDYEQAWQASDAEGLADLFTEDGFVRARSGWIRGREAISDHYGNAGGDLRLRALAYSTNETTGYIVGAYGYGDSAAETDRGVFVLALRRESTGGPWRIAADLDNSVN